MNTVPNTPQRPNPKYLVGLGLAIAMSLVTKYEPGRNPNIAYSDPIAVSRVATVCNGHTGPGIIVGKWYSDDQCNAWTREDIAKAYSAVYHCTKVPLTERQLGALADFALNEGGEALCTSQFLRAANSGAKPSIWCPLLSHYESSAGKHRLGLESRRNDEIKLCLEGT